MRTTLDLDEDVLAAARVVSEETGASLGAAVSELARRGMRPQSMVSGFPMFGVSLNSRPITSEMVREALEGSLFGDGSGTD